MADERVPSVEEAIHTLVIACEKAMPVGPDGFYGLVAVLRAAIEREKREAQLEAARQTLHAIEGAIQTTVAEIQAELSAARKEAGDE